MGWACACNEVWTKKHYTIEANRVVAFKISHLPLILLRNGWTARNMTGWNVMMKLVHWKPLCIIFLLQTSISDGVKNNGSTDKNLKHLQFPTLIVFSRKVKTLKICLVCRSFHPKIYHTCDLKPPLKTTRQVGLWKVGVTWFWKRLNDMLLGIKKKSEFFLSELKKNCDT